MTQIFNCMMVANGIMAMVFVMYHGMRRRIIRGCVLMNSAFLLYWLDMIYTIPYIAVPLGWFEFIVLFQSRLTVYQRILFIGCWSLPVIWSLPRLTGDTAMLAISLCTSVDTFGNIVGKLVAAKYNRPVAWLATISPNKSYAGYAGSLVAGNICGYMLSHPYSTIQWNAFIVAAIIGDLFASAVKRTYGIKSGRCTKHVYPYGGYEDFSQLMGSHGGVLDRTDSHILVIPLMVLYG